MLIIIVYLFVLITMARFGNHLDSVWLVYRVLALYAKRIFLKGVTNVIWIL